MSLSFVETLVRENKLLKEKLEKSSEALIAFHEKSIKDSEMLEELKKKYKEEKRLRTSLQPIASENKPSHGFRRKSIDEEKPPFLSRASAGSRIRSQTSLEASYFQEDNKNGAHRGSCRLCSCKGFKSTGNSSWLCNCGHINLKHL